jgi:hypothetical protein
VAADDIGAVTAFDGRVGVLWSNQITGHFGFRVHFPWAPPTLWEADEVPASQSANPPAGSMADDHLNFAVSSDGTLYAAVKSEWDPTLGLPKIGVLVRRPSGQWDDLHGVDEFGTSPIMLLNEALGALLLVYTEREGGAGLVYRVSDAQNIAFGPSQPLLSGPVNDASSTDQSFIDDLVIISSTPGPNRDVKGVFLAP